MLLFPLAALKRASERVLPDRQSGSDLTIGTGWVNAPLKWVLSFEAPFVARLRLPFGLTVVALGRKRQRIALGITDKRVAASQAR
jgi:hypothetical protein